MLDLQQALSRWNLMPDGEPLHTRTSVLQPAVYHGVPAMLKIPLCEEERRGAAVMHWWNGDGAVRMLAYDGGTLLLERICGGTLTELVHTGNDDTASRVLCEVAARLHAPREQALPELVPLTRWFAALTTSTGAHGDVIRKAAVTAKTLLAAAQEITMLHGDLHHENILDGGERGWLAIDPKGLLGERGFDFANLFYNPDYAIATAPGRLERQVEVVCEAAQLEHKRLLEWIIAWAGLSAVWHMEDGGTPETALAVAEMAFHALHP